MPVSRQFATLGGGMRRRATALQLANLVVLGLLSCLPISFQQHTAALVTCSGVLALGPSRLLSTLSSQGLADGALVSAAVAKWDFQGRSGVLSAAAGANVTLSCLVASNVTVAPPSVGRSAAGAFLQPTALDLSSASGLAMSGVSLDTDCATVLAYQQHLCTSLAAAGSLTLEQGAVRFSRWRDGFTALDNVNLTCPSPSAAPQPPCRLVAVQTAQQLLEAFTVHAVAAGRASENLIIIISANLSLSKSTWPIGSPVAVDSNVTVVGSSLLRRPVLDFNLHTGLWDLTLAATVELRNLTCANLAPAYFRPGLTNSQFGLLSDRLWAFRRDERQVHILDTTLIKPPEELAYTKYWLTFLVSPVPEAQAKAAWFKVIDIKIDAVNTSGVYYTSVRSFTTTFDRVHLTDTLGPGYPLLPIKTGLRQLQAGSVPLTSVNRVINAPDFLLALDPENSSPDDVGRRWVLLTGNFSIADGDAWPTAAGAGGDGSPSSGQFAPGTVALPGIMVFERAASLDAVRLGLGWRVDALGVPSSAILVMRGMVLSDLGTRGSAYDRGDPLAVLASPLWGVALAAGASKTRLENCTVLVSADELRLLQQALMAAGAATGRAYDGVLVAALRTFLTSADTLQLSASNGSSLQIRVMSGATSRYTMSNVLFRTPVTADGETARVNLTALGVPYDTGTGDGGSGGLEGWEVGVIVGCVVGGVLLLALAGLVVVRRRRMRRQPDVGDADDKDLQSAALEAAADRQQCGPQTGQASQDMEQLTGSSTVLRSGARNNDTEGTVGIKVGSRTTSNAGRDSSSTAGGGLGSSAATTGAGGGTSGPGGIGRNVRVSGSSGGLLPSPYTTTSAIANVTAAALAAVAAAESGISRGLSRAPSDSFDNAPSTTTLRQHGPAGRGSTVGTVGPPSSGQRTGLASSCTTGDAGVSNSSQIASAGGGALEQMHQMIQAFGRDFNDKQLAVQGVLGKGAHGTVYKGTWRGLAVAVKSMILSSDTTARHQHRPLMEAAISSNLAHANIVTTYSYELREVQHELASLSPELAQQGGGWRLLIIQEFCDAGPLRRLVDCGFFLTPPKLSSVRSRAKLRQPPTALMLAVGSDSGVASAGGASLVATTPNAARGAPAAGTPGAAVTTLDLTDAGASGDENNGDSSGDDVRVGEGAMVSRMLRRAGGTFGSQFFEGCQPVKQGQSLRPALEEVPADVPSRPGSSVQAALRYVEAALMIARGLQHIHDKNIVHGDLNPNNVLLLCAPDTPLGFCLKVADFGLSVRMADGESHLSNLFQGTPYYCAPEVVHSGKVGKSADLYSLGIMLWELQNGTRPPWRMGVRLRTYPSLNTGELEFGPDTPPRYVRLARDCFRGSSSSRPGIAAVVSTLGSIKADLDC